MEKDERQVAEWYNNLSSSYDELYAEEQSRKHNTVLEFMGDRHLRVLIDIGCGTGTFLNRAQEVYDQGIGVDLSPKMLQIAKKRNTPNADYVLASSSALPVKNASSDCTVSVSTAKAEPNLSSFIADVERIAREDSLLAITLFYQQGMINPMSALGPKQSIIISERETLYFLRRAKRPEIAAESTNGDSWTLRTRPAPLALTRMPGCSHQWRGRGQMARCIRCGKLKTDFRKEQHNQKMLAREDSES